MKTNIITLLIAASCFMTLEANAQVIFEKVDSHMPFAEMISEIELIPLEADSVNMLRTEIWCKHGYCPVPEFTVHSTGPEIIVTKDAYILSDPGQDRIFRYSMNGEFINSIGSTDNENQMMLNAQPYDGQIHVYYSNPDVARRYAADGSLLSSENIEDPGSEGWMTKEGRLAWYGYGSGRPGRLGLWNGKDSTTFLPTDAKVLNLDLGVPVFTQDGKDLLFTDGTRSTVMKYRKGKVCRHIDIDLGEFAINDSYYMHEDAMEAAMEMMSKPFGVVDRYVRDGKYGFAEVTIQDNANAVVNKYYGICRKDRWTWFSPGTPNTHPFVSSSKPIKGKTIYAILNPDILENMQEDLKDRISTVLQETPEDFIIAKIHLK